VRATVVDELVQEAEALSRRNRRLAQALVEQEQPERS